LQTYITANDCYWSANATYITGMIASLTACHVLNTAKDFLVMIVAFDRVVIALFLSLLVDSNKV
jgi:hypothetical protein